MTDGRSRHAVACVEKSEDLTELKRAIAEALASPERESAFPLRTAAT